MLRKSEVYRKTGETEIKINLDIDGEGIFTGKSGIGFFDHMLTLLAKHSRFNLELNCSGDLEVDSHHTIEDIGIVLGETLAKALGDKAGIKRYGNMILPMDETLILAALDISGRPFLNFDVELPKVNLGNFEVEMVEEFLRALSVHGGITLHIKQLAGKNIHHIVEAIFKALAMALKEAVTIDPTIKGVLSTKGSL